MYTKGKWKADDYRQVTCREKVICFIGLQGHMEDDEDEPNAQLIASAPDYHELIKDMFAFNILSPTHNRGLYARAKRIQAKAEGK